MAKPQPPRQQARCLWVALAAATLGVADGLIFEGFLPTRSTGEFAEFVGKFCYDFTRDRSDTSTFAGTFTVELTNEAGHELDFSSGNLYFLAFDDERSHWKHVRRHWSSTTCEEKVKAASLARRIDSSKGMASFSQNVQVFEHVRPRFWYFTFVGCGLEVKPDFIRYTVHMKNDMWGAQEEFSLDHMNLVYVQAASWACFTASGLVAFYFMVVRSEAQDPPLREHPYVQFLLMAYSASSLSSAAFMLHYFLVVHNGYGSMRLRFLGILFGIAGNCVMYMMSILAACGWAITSPVLPHRRFFMALITVVGGIQGLCELHSEVTTTQSTQLFVYAGPSGALILVLKLFLFSWFAFQVRSTYLDESSEKRRQFYKWFGFAVGFWALTVPVATILAFQVSPWFRYKVVVGFDIASRYLVLAMITQLFSGPLSPLCRENIFSVASMQNSPVVRRAEGWKSLST